MNVFEICLESIEVNTQKIGTPWGIIYIKCDDFCFPDNDWFDAASSILEMWLSILNDFFSANKNRCTLPFMDGPFEIELTKCEFNNIVLLCKSNDMVISEYKICALALINSVQETALKLLDHYQQHSLCEKNKRLYQSILSGYAQLKKLGGQGDSLRES